MAPPVTQVSPEEKKHRKLLTTVITLNAISAVLMLAAVGVGSVLLFAKVNVKPHEDKREAKDIMPGPAFKIEDSIYNLGETNRYARAAVEVELDIEGMDEKGVAEFMDEARTRMPWIRDLVIVHLSGKIYRDVATPEGKNQLKEELRVKINALLSRGQVREVMFTSFAVQ